MIVDRQGRRFRNLRISLTSACNYACTYCVPNGKRLVAAQDELSAEAMVRGVAYLIEAAGIERLRITGGEPLISPKLDTFMREVGRLGLGDIFGSLPEFNGDAQRFKSVGFGAVCAIGAVHRDSFGVQHFGQNAHTGTADTDEMGGAEIRRTGRSIE